jgi:hypothetical protein
MKRLHAVALVAVVACTIPAIVLAARSQTDGQVLTVNIGDVVRIAGAGNVGCKVVRHSGFKTLDCRRAGRLAGTYGTLFNKREVLLVRFLGAKTAKVVVEARHGAPNAHICS